MSCDPNAACTPADDKEILFIRGTYPSTDPRLTWDYTQQPPLLSVGGKIAASGSIATSSEVDGSFFSPLALGTGSFNFTPQSGYGGLIYRGGSLFYYWDNSLNAWEPIDFASHVTIDTQVIAGPGLIGGGPLSSNVTLALDPNYELIDIYHNGVFTAKKSSMNFQDSVSVSWGITSNGDVNVLAFGTGGGAWIANVNANNYSINSLNSINGIPVSLFCTNPFNRNVTGNNYDLTGVGNVGVTNNLSVGGSFTYKGIPIEDYIATSGLWTLNADGSISRNSNVFINGVNTPLIVTSTTASGYIYVNTTGAGGNWSAFGAEIGGVYSGEIGFGPSTLEIWTKTSIILRGYDTTGNAQFPGSLGIGLVPSYKLDVLGNANASSCYLVNGVTFACNNGAGGITVNATTINASGDINTNSRFLVNGIILAQGNGVGGINLTNVAAINGSTGFSQTPWATDINGNGFSLTNATNISANGTVSSTGLTVGSSGANIAGNVNTSSCYYVAGIQFACSNGAGGINLASIATINGAPPGTSGGGGPTQGGQTQTLRSLNVTYQNTTGKPMYVSVSVLFNTPGEAVAFVGPTSPATAMQLVRINTGASTEGTWSMMFIVLPGQYYQIIDSIGGASVGPEDWCEWW